jgi:gas vesicle protein
MALLVGAGVGLFLAPQRGLAQACKDELSMVDGSKQALVELAETVKKESLPDFVRLNHQKSAVNKLTLHDSVLGELVSCLDKAAQDTSAPKADVDAAKAQHDASAKLLDKIQQERAAIKDAKTPKDAKALVEKIDLTS